ncbi:MAG: preprotein translocase subunit SecD, partial [Bdellovibrionales bacterium]
NVFSLLALLSALGATLTLPGIAGITLTMGMAIDANVIIFERIKEELARGAAMKTAIREGFHHAWTAIFDSNVTNAIAAAVLVYFGTGPVRGFGVTLIAGIVTTMITAVFVSHFFLDLLTNTFKIKKLRFKKGKRVLWQHKHIRRRKRAGAVTISSASPNTLRQGRSYW